AVVDAGSAGRLARTGPDEQLGVGSAEPGRTVRPPVVRLQPGDPIDAQLAPDAAGPLVGWYVMRAAEDAGAERARRQPEALGNELVAPAQRLFVRIAAERP